MRVSNARAAALAVALLLSGCASLPAGQGIAESRALVEQRSKLSIDQQARPMPTAAIDVDEAVRLALANGPGVPGIYAQLGFARAEIESARRLANPSFGFGRLDAAGGRGRQTTRSLTLGLSDLLLMPSRTRFASAEFERVQSAVASELLGLVRDVEVAWYTAVGATQVAAMRSIVARAADTSAELAQRYFDAGNIARLQLEQERAAAAQARIAAVRAQSLALRARADLADLIGARSRDDWTISDRLGLPLRTKYEADEITDLALEQRLDLASARAALALREGALGSTRRWRWLGGVELGYERETEVDGGVMRGPSLGLTLPLFDQGQAGMARAQAYTDQARSEVDTLALSVRNAASTGIERVELARDIADRYRTMLLPAREAIVARSQEQVNFMLIGVFELIRARQDEYDAYQEYMEAVRDYWIARAELRHVAGGNLPDDDTPIEPVVGAAGMLPVTGQPMDHDGHDGHSPSPAPAANDDDVAPEHHHHHQEDTP
jgi:outer membrane protein, heavy metal efflux system